MYQKISFTHICFIFSMLVCLFFSSHTLFSQQVSPNAIIFGGMRITSEIPSGVRYDGKREIRWDLKIAEEEWKETLPDGTINMNVKPPESEVYTYIVRAHGIGKLDLSLNDSGIPRDVGEFRLTYVEPTPLTKHREFYCYDRANCTVIRSYLGNYVAVYEDTCIPIANEGFKSEVMQGTEPLHAEASVVPWEIDIQYGTEEAINKKLEFGVGWPPTVGADAGYGETSTKKWGWRLREILHKKRTADPFSGSFTVKIIDNEISNSKKQIPVTVCVTCPNCNGSVNTVDDHVKKVKPHGGEEGELVPATCPVEAITEPPGTTVVAGCGKKIYECTELEAALQEAWHQIRTCDNRVGLIGGTCGVKFRHCTNENCRKRPLLKRDLGHSDGSVSQAPTNGTNNYPQSHTDRQNSEAPATPTATLTSSDGSSTATAGSSFTVNVSLPTGYTLLYWYIKAPGESGYGTSVSSVSDSTGNSTTASYTYTMPSGASGDYVLTAYAYLSDSTIAEPSYTVSVSSGGSSTPAPAPSPPSNDNTPNCDTCTDGCSACPVERDPALTHYCPWCGVYYDPNNNYSGACEVQGFHNGFASP